MTLVIGRITLDPPESFAEAVGQDTARVGATPVPGGRSGLSVSPGLTSWADTAAEREVIRRQLRSMLNNLPMRASGVYVAWSDDPEQDGWYVPGASTFELEGVVIDTAVYRFSGSWSLIGRRRSHRRAVKMTVQDRRLATTPRDYRGTIYSTNFASLDALSLVYLPSAPVDPTLTGTASAAMGGPRTGYGGASIQPVVGAADLSVISFDQDPADRNLGDVVIYDRAGTVTAPTTGPATTWEEVYGPDWPQDDWITPAADAPVIENGFCRVRYDASNTGGLALDTWDGAAWSEEAKVLVYRVGDTSGYCDTLVSSDVLEWTPERGAVRVVMNRDADAYSREEIIVTLQRGWSGPRVEVYPAVLAAGTPAGAAIRVFSASAPGSDSAFKVDDSATAVVTATAGSGGTSFTAATLGDSTFTADNHLTLVRPDSDVTLIAAVVQSGATGRVESDTSAYGSARNGIGVTLSAGGYISAHLGMSARNADQALEAESMTLGSGTSSGSDGSASAGSATTATRTSTAVHVSQATWLDDALGIYRVFARVKAAAASTLSVSASTTATTGSTKTTTSTSYTWVDLGEIEADGSTLSIRAWLSSGTGTFSVDRIEAVALEAREGSAPLYDGSRDLGESILYDVRADPTVQAR